MPSPKTIRSRETKCYTYGGFYQYLFLFPKQWARYEILILACRDEMSVQTRGRAPQVKVPSSFALRLEIGNSPPPVSVVGLSIRIFSLLCLCPRHVWARARAFLVPGREHQPQLW